MPDVSRRTRAARRAVVPVRVAAVAFVSALVTGAVIAAQSTGAKPPPQDQRPVFRSDANFVRVDVYPTRDGQAVQDLRAEEFEVQEDGVTQAIQTFEHVVVSPAGPQSIRVEPNSVGQSLQMAANPRNRVFVIFLDTPHVTVSASWNIREPLVRLIDRILGPDDLVGIMTPGMAASDVVLARKTAVIEGGLRERWPWGERFILQRSEAEDMYRACYPALAQEGVVLQMEARRRERVTLDAMNELVQYLHNIREERKAILTVTEGWLLYRPDDSMTRLRVLDPTTGTTERIPGPEPISVGPDGRITTKSNSRGSGPYDKSACDADRQRLSLMDNDQYFKDIIGEANRANASFYVVDPRGLPVFDTPMGPAPPPTVTQDFAMLRTRTEAMRTLAGATDGIAVMNSNDLDGGLKRISDDLTSYYLLGYYSTNGKLDGRFRNIKVRVKRPGTDVRARRGYRAATEKEVVAAKTAAAAPVPEIVTAVSAAMGALDRVRPGIRFFVNAVPVLVPGSTSISTIWVAGELQSAGAADPWARGGTADIDVRVQGASVTARATLAPGDRGFVVPVQLAAPASAGAIDVRVRLTGNDPAAERPSDSVSVDVAAASRPLLFRRGPSTGNRLQPVATFQFSRTERARLEVPIGADATPGSGRLVDKAGQAIAVPVVMGERKDDATGQRWLTADLTLAPLAPGDYAVEVTAVSRSGEQRTVTAIRVVR